MGKMGRDWMKGFGKRGKTSPSLFVLEGIGDKVFVETAGGRANNRGKPNQWLLR